VLIDFIIILMKVGTSNPDARASIGGWLTHLMRSYPMFKVMIFVLYRLLVEQSAKNENKL
jgi:hypothetical protein